MTVEDPDTYLDVRYAKLALVCVRGECAVSYRLRGGAPMLRDLVIELPERCLPEYAVLIRAKHVATHVQFDTVKVESNA